MWAIDNNTPFATERGWARDRTGAEIWLVVVKCTFDIQPDGSTLVSNDQPPVLRLPEYQGDAVKSSLRYEADLVLTKTTTDIVVVGHAYAPNGRPVAAMEVGFSVGPVQKSLIVFGDRVWRSVGISEPEPFVTIPIVYERAFGGVDERSDRPDRDWDWRNPVGTGFAAARDHITGVRLPNLEYADRPIRSWNDRPQPASFGPIGAHWQPRAGFAGTYDEQWMEQRRPLPPHDFDDRFFQCVPPDQRAPYFLRGGEPVSLHGLTLGRELRFFLPKLFLGFETRFLDGSRVYHRDRKLHTVIVEPDHPRVSLVWHTALACHHKVHKLAETIVTLKTELEADGEADEDDREIA